MALGSMVAQGIGMRGIGRLTEHSGAKRSAERGSNSELIQWQHLQGLKPDINLIGFIGPTEVVPCYKAFES